MRQIKKKSQKIDPPTGEQTPHKNRLLANSTDFSTEKRKRIVSSAQARSSLNNSEQKDE